jgi:hypothetical protein
MILKSIRRFSLPMLAAGIACAADPLVIQILRGASTNNNAIAGSTSPVVRIVTSGGVPVPGALVVFTAPSTGASVDFTGYGRVAQAITDETGSAAAPSVKPAGADGQVEIRVMATKDGRSANASIFQMNLGVSRSSEPPDALEIVVIPDADLPTLADVERSARRRRIGFRIEDSVGNPVPGAQVQMAVEVRRRSGKIEPLERIDRISAGDGWVLATVDRSGTDPLELTVRATMKGRMATRYFTLK